MKKRCTFPLERFYCPPLLHFRAYLYFKKREEIILHGLTTRIKAKSKTKGTMASMVYHALTKCRTKILGFD